MEDEPLTQSWNTSQIKDGLSNRGGSRLERVNRPAKKKVRQGHRKQEKCEREPDFPGLHWAPNPYKSACQGENERKDGTRQLRCRVPRTHSPAQECEQY